MSWPKRDGIYSFLRHLGPFGCIKTAIFSENANLSKTGFQEKNHTKNFTDHQVQFLNGFAVLHTHTHTKHNTTPYPNYIFHVRPSCFLRRQWNAFPCVTILKYASGNAQKYKFLETRYSFKCNHSPIVLKSTFQNIVPADINISFMTSDRIKTGLVKTALAHFCIDLSTDVGGDSDTNLPPRGSQIISPPLISFSITYWL